MNEFTSKPDFFAYVRAKYPAEIDDGVDMFYGAYGKANVEECAKFIREASIHLSALGPREAVGQAEALAEALARRGWL